GRTAVRAIDRGFARGREPRGVAEFARDRAGGCGKGAARAGDQAGGWEPGEGGQVAGDLAADAAGEADGVWVASGAEGCQRRHERRTRDKPPILDFARKPGRARFGRVPQASGLWAATTARPPADRRIVSCDHEPVPFGFRPHANGTKSIADVVYQTQNHAF